MTMSFDWKELITPIVTVMTVWLGAKFALSNEVRKTELDLETKRLERLALECNSSLNNLHKYCLRVTKILEDLSEKYTKRITLANVTECLKKSAEAGTSFDIEAAQQFQNTLELHRQADFEEWKKLILPLLKHLSEMLASPSLANDDSSEELSRQYLEPEVVKNYNQKLAELAAKLPSYRCQLFGRISDDYQALMHPASPNMWIMMRKARLAFHEFVRYYPPSQRNNTRL
ncbi:hypothetical protein [Klebsiella sp. KE9767]|uniref:hypothetical protein n=1 Tax=Klebsiella sp. KE9767 TaxID=3118151 RepID=UPI003753366D